MSSPRNLWSCASRRPCWPNFNGSPPAGIYAKDMILALIGRYGVDAGVGHVVEYAGAAIRSMPVEGRMTVSNMSIEFGARGGIIAADDTTFEYLHGREMAPKGALWDRAVNDWRVLFDKQGDAEYDRVIEIDCVALKPQVTWGNSPQDVLVDRSGGAGPLLLRRRRPARDGATERSVIWD